MATAERENPLGFVDKRRSTAANANAASSQLATPANYGSVNSLRTRLAALGVASTQLDLMTRNDMVYAVRLADDPTGI